jgi:hypothetical protein
VALVFDVESRASFEGCERWLGDIRQNLQGPAYPGSVAAHEAPPAPILKVCHYIIQPLVELYGDCMVVVKVL